MWVDAVSGSHPTTCGAIIQGANLNTVTWLNIAGGMAFELFEVSAAPNDPQMSVNESIMAIKP